MPIEMLKAAADTVVDTVEQVAVATNLKQKEPCNPKVGPRGEIDYDIDFSEVQDKGTVSQIKQKLRPFVEERARLQAELAQARANGDAAQVEMLEGDIAELDKFLADIKHKIEHHVSLVEALSMITNALSCGLAGLAMAGVANGVVDNSEGIWNKVDKTVNEQDPMLIEPEPLMGEVATREGEASGKASGEADKPPHPYLEMTMEELVDAMHADPDAFWENMSQMAPEDRTIVWQKIQTQLQQINQMFTMMSNFAKSSHDTQKAILNNMRV